QTDKAKDTVDQTGVNVQGQGQDDSMSFWDFLDVINPLHHLPVVGDMYRELTGDTIKPSTQMAGGILFGGPFGMVSGVYNAMIEQTSGQGIAGTVVAALSGEADATTAPSFVAQPRAAGGVMLASLELGPSTNGAAPVEAVFEPAILVADADGPAPVETSALTTVSALADTASTGPSASPSTATYHDGHHAITPAIAAAHDPALAHVLLAAADSYASERSVDAFLTLAAGPASNAPAASQPATPIQNRAGSGAGSIQFAGIPATASILTPGVTPQLDAPATGRQMAEAADAAAVNGKVAETVTEAVADAGPRRRILAAGDANPIPLEDVRRYNRAVPLFAGASSRRDDVKAADVAEAASRLAIIRAAEQEAASAANDRISPAVARSVAPSEPALAAPTGPAGIQDPFGRSISPNNLADKMMHALDKYRSSGNLGGAGI
ncbi:MAG: hypothetical protein AAF213_10130, partial [Pseudomonadota bacterium]